MAVHIIPAQTRCTELLSHRGRRLEVPFEASADLEVLADLTVERLGLRGAAGRCVVEVEVEGQRAELLVRADVLVTLRPARPAGNASLWERYQGHRDAIWSDWKLHRNDTRRDRELSQARDHYEAELAALIEAQTNPTTPPAAQATPSPHNQPRQNHGAEALDHQGNDFGGTVPSSPLTTGNSHSERGEAGGARCAGRGQVFPPEVLHARRALAPGQAQAPVQAAAASQTRDQRAQAREATAPEASIEASIEATITEALSMLGLRQTGVGWFVTSSRTPQRAYQVQVCQCRATNCSCPQRTFRKVVCKHMELVDLLPAAIARMEALLAHHSPRRLLHSITLHQRNGLDRDAIVRRLACPATRAQEAS